jgi:hypothetical protein
MLPLHVSATILITLIKVVILDGVLLIIYIVPEAKTH